MNGIDGAREIATAEERDNRPRMAHEIGMVLPPDRQPAGGDQVSAADQASDTALDLLRPLARRAVGMSGADIERLVREARGRARREQRPLSWNDLEHLVSAGRPAISDDLRWHLAIHESGHAIIHLVLGRNGIEIMTVEGPQGGFVRLRGEDDTIQSEALAMDHLTMLLGGRRAEIALFGHALSGAGGEPDSDLGRATAMAVYMETTLGYARHQPLLFRKMSDPTTQLLYDRELVSRVNARLEEADARAASILDEQLDALVHLARELARARTLEGSQLRNVLADVQVRLSGVRP